MLSLRASLAPIPLLLASTAMAQWPLYAPSNVGLTTPIHSTTTGFRWASLFDTAPGGACCGLQNRFEPGTDVLVGQSGFVYLPAALPGTGSGTTVRVGFYSALYANATTGEAETHAKFITDNHTVGGHSRTLTGARHAWVWTPAAGAGGEVRIGLQGADHTSPSGKQYSEIIGAANGAGVLVGESDRFGGAGQGETIRTANHSLFAWSQATGTVRLGFFGGAYTDVDGEQDTFIDTPASGGWVSSNGSIVGVSRRYDATPGSDGWVWHATTGSVRCGLRGAGYTGAGGVFAAVPEVVSENGTVAGYSNAYDPVTFASRGQQSWAWTAAGGAVPIGLTGAQYLSSGGLLTSGILAIGPGGEVIGRTRNRGAVGGDGMDVWHWSAAAGTQRIGLYGPDLTSGTDGYENFASRVYPGGVVIGEAEGELFDADPAVRIGWVFTPGAGSAPGTTVEVMPPDAQFRSTSGRCRVSLADYNPTTRRIVGSAMVYDGETERGYKGFMFNPVNGNYTVFSFMASQSGESNTLPLRIFDDHTVLGNYYRYDDGSPFFQFVGFLWKAGQGKTDLLSRIDTEEGGLSSMGLEGPVGAFATRRLTDYDTIIGLPNLAGFVVGSNQQAVALHSLTCGTAPDTFTLKDLYTAARQPQMTTPQGADQALIHSVGQTGVTPMRGVRLGGAGAPPTNPVVWGAHTVSTNIPAVGPAVTADEALLFQDRSPSLSGVFIQPGNGTEAAVSTYRPGQAGTLAAVTLNAEVLGNASDGVRISLVRINASNAVTTVVAQQPVAYTATGHSTLSVTGGVLPMALAADDRLVLTVDRGAGASTTTEDWAVVDLRFGFVGPPLMITQPTTGPLACLGQDESITAGVAGAAAYQWLKDGEELADGPTGHSSRIVGANTATLTIRSASPEDAGVYTCLASNACGSAISLPSNLTVESCACGPADLGRQGGFSGFDGWLDNNDFIVFIDLFFLRVPPADRGVQGGFPGQDGQYDNNDFIVFIDQFFAGC